MCELIHLSLPGRIWARVGEIITAALQDENFEVDARRCRERTMLLLDYYKKQDFPSLRRLARSLHFREKLKQTVLFPEIRFFFGASRFGTERLYAQKEDLLHEVLELEAEKGLLASGESTKYQVGVRGVVLTVSVLLTPNVAIELRSCRWLNSFGNGNGKWKDA